MGGQSDVTERFRAVLGSRSANELAEALGDPSPDVARAAVQRLVEIEGPDAAPRLRPRLLDSDPVLAVAVAGALRSIGDGEALDLALAGLREERHPLRLAAARALGALGDPRAAGALRAALDDAVSGVRIAVLGALGQLGSTSGAGRDCARLLSDRDPHVRVAAVKALARVSPRAGTAMAKAARDEDWIVRLEVAHHVGALPENVARTLLGDRELRVREAAAQSAGAAHIGTLAVLLTEDPSSDVRHAVADSLGRVGDKRVADVLIPGIEDSDAIVGTVVLRGLERLLTRTGAIDRLCTELGSRRARRRRACLYALGHLEALEASDEAWRLVNDPDPDVRLALVHTASSILEDPQPLIRYLGTDSDATVRDSAEMWLLREGGVR